MDTKELVLKKLGWDKLGKRCGRLVGYNEDGSVSHCNYGEEVAMEVVRVTDERDYVIGRYDEKAQIYRVAYDPNVKQGRIKNIANVYCKPKASVNPDED